MKKLPDVTTDLYVKMITNSQWNCDGEFVYNVMSINLIRIVDNNFLNILNIINNYSNKQLENSFKLIS